MDGVIAANKGCSGTIELVHIHHAHLVATVAMKARRTAKGGVCQVGGANGVVLIKTCGDRCHVVHELHGGELKADDVSACRMRGRNRLPRCSNTTRVLVYGGGRATLQAVCNSTVE